MAYPYSTKAPLNGQIPTKGQLSDKRSPYTSNCIYFLVWVEKDSDCAVFFMNFLLKCVKTDMKEGDDKYFH